MFDLNYALLDQLQRMQQEVEELFGGGARGDIRSAPRGTFPAINVGNSPDKVDVYLFAPGVDAKGLDVHVQDNLLTIEGRRARNGSEGGKPLTYYRRERYEGDFRRIVALSDDVDPERIKASYVDGILHIQVPRRESARPRRIEIH